MKTRIATTGEALRRAVVVSTALATLCALPLASRAAAQDDVAPVKFRGAVMLQNDDLFDAAIDAWKKFLKDYPDHRLTPSAKYNLAVCHQKTKAHDAAIPLFQEVIKAPKDFEHVERTYLLLGASQHALGKAGKKEMFDAEVATYDAVLKAFPKGKGTFTADTYYSRAEAQYALGKKDLAIADYTAVTKEFPTSPHVGSALYSIGFVHQEQRQWPQAETAYAGFLSNKALEKHSLLSEVRMRYGEVLLEQNKNLADAAKWLQSAASDVNFLQADHATSRMAQCLAVQGKPAEAADVYLSITAKFPKLKNVDPNFALLEGGKQAYLAKQHAKARAALIKVVAVGGDSGAEAAHWTARSFLQEQNAAEALKVVDAALAKAKGTKFENDLMLDRADALLEVPEQRKAAVAAFYELSTKATTPALAQQALYNATYAAMKTGDFTTAVKYAEEYFTKHKEANQLAVEVLFIQAESLLALKQYDKAAPLYQKLIDGPPHAEKELIRVRVAECLYRQQKYDTAAAAFQAQIKAITKPQLRAEANYLLGNCQAELGQHAEAIKSFEAALKDGSAEWALADDASVLAARAYVKLKDFKSAVPLLRKVLAIKGSNVLIDAHYQLAECSTELGDFKTAAEEYQLVIDAKDDRFAPFAWYGLGWALDGQKMLPEGAAAFSKVIELYPTHRQARLAYLARGSVYEKLSQFEKAESDLTKYLTLEPMAPKKSDIRFTIGKCQSKQKKYAEAEKTFVAILAEDAKFERAPEVMYELAWALSDQKKTDDAEKVFIELSTKYPDSPLGIDGLLQVTEMRYADGADLLTKGEKEKANANKAFTAAAKMYFDILDKAEKLNTAGKLTAKRAGEIRELAMHKYGWCFFHLNDFANAEKSFDAQIKGFPAGKFTADGKFMFGESLYQQSKFVEAEVALRTYARDHAAERFAPNALWHTAVCLNTLGIEAMGKAADAAGRTKAQEFHVQALAQLGGFATRFPNFEKELMFEVQYEEARANHYLGNKDKAEAAYEAIAAKTVREPAAKARFMVGELYFEKAVQETDANNKRKLLLAALTNFYNCANGYGYRNWSANSLYEAARCLELLANPSKAVERYKELIEKYPDSDKAPRAKERIAKLSQ